MFVLSPRFLIPALYSLASIGNLSRTGGIAGDLLLLIGTLVAAAAGVVYQMALTAQ